MVRLTDYDGGAYFARIKAGRGAVFEYDPATNEVTLGAERRLAVRFVGADATVGPEDDVVVVDAGGPATVRLPPAAGWVGRTLDVCRHSASGAATVLCDGADRIWGPGANGVASQGLNSRGAVIRLLGETAATWRVLSATGNVQLLDLPEASTLPMLPEVEPVP